MSSRQLFLSSREVLRWARTLFTFWPDDEEPFERRQSGRHKGAISNCPGTDSDNGSQVRLKPYPAMISSTSA
jgi:hypothetical protein